MARSGPAQRRKHRNQVLLDFAQGFGVYLASVAGVVARRFTSVYRATGSVDGFMAAWPEMVIALISGLFIMVGVIDAGGMKIGKRKNWPRRMMMSFVAGIAADGATGDVF